MTDRVINTVTDPRTIGYVHSRHTASHLVLTELCVTTDTVGRVYLFKSVAPITIDGIVVCDMPRVVLLYCLRRL